MLKHLVLITSVIVLMSACEQAKNNQDNAAQDQEKAAETTKANEQNNAEGEAEAVDASNKTVVAKVNGIPIYKEDLNGLTVPKSIQNEIYFQEALKKGYDKKYAKNVENFRRSLYINQLKSAVITDYLENNPVSEDEIEEFIKDKKDDYIYLKVVKVTIDNPELAEKVVEKAKSSKDLKKAAADLGVSSENIGEDNFSKSYNDYFEVKDINEVSDIIGGGEENVIAQIIEIKELPTEQIARTERYSLIAKKKREAVANYEMQLKKDGKYNVEVVK